MYRKKRDTEKILSCIEMIKIQVLGLVFMELRLVVGEIFHGELSRDGNCFSELKSESMLKRLSFEN